MDDLREYPICAACKKQIDLQEGPVCLDCREAMNESAEFDAITIYRVNIEEQVGRPLTDEEWENLTIRIGKELDLADWVIVDKAINDIKKNEAIDIP